MADSQRYTQGAPGVVIIGAGHAGVECAYALRTAGYELPISLISAEPFEPYQRPPLSKGFLAGAMDAKRLALRSSQAYEKQDIQVIMGDPVLNLDAARSSVVMASGWSIDYSHCVVATGARARILPSLQGPNVYSLRNVDDALALQSRLNNTCRLLVVGGGYLGLEVAATAAKLGAKVIVLEQSPVLMSGKVSPHTSSAFESMHDRAGIRIMQGATIDRWEALQSGGWKAYLSDGSTYEGDVVLVSVGAVPDIKLAVEAGIACDGGVLVDEQFRTSVQNIFAIGDCASGYRADLACNARVESVQNALDSARIAAATIAGRPPASRRPATFWTEQHGRRLQIAGIINPAQEVLDIVITTENGWLVERYQQNFLMAIEALDCPIEFIKSMKLIGSAQTLANPIPSVKKEATDAHS
nr:FAD-dependent oxidoreductase [Pusillimonas sp. T7-7]